MQPYKSIKTIRFIAFIVFLAGIFSIHKLTANSNSNENQIKILTWWGYLSDKQKISEIEIQCGVNLDITEYTTVEDLVAMSNVNSYDIYIYPWGYNLDIKENLPPSNSNLTDLTNDYHPNIKEKYNNSNIPENTLFFQHAVSMFVYNQDYFPTFSEITLDDIFDASKNGKVFLMNEPKQVDWLLSSRNTSSNDTLWNQLYASVKESKRQGKYNEAGFEFSNFGQDYINENLLIGYLDSGEILNPNLDWNPNTNKKINLKFDFHNTMSHVSSDVISLNSNKPKAECLARKLGSRDFLKWISEENYYFSPYHDIPNGLSPDLISLSNKFYENLNNLAWIDDLLFNHEPSKHALNTWKKIRKCQDLDKCD